jgi:hypothetical protein
VGVSLSTPYKETIASRSPPPTKTFLSFASTTPDAATRLACLPHPFPPASPPPRPLLLLGFPTPPPPDPEPDGARSHGAAAGVQLRYDASASAAQIRPRSAARVSFLVFTGSLFLPVPAADPLYPELWRACAGPLVTVPRPGDLVYYFPQGHIEQVRLHTPPPSSSCCLPLMFREPSLISCCCVRVR